MDSQTVFNVLVLFGGGGLGAFLVFALNFRKQNTDEIVSSRNVLVEDNVRLKTELTAAYARIESLAVSQRLEREETLKQIASVAAEQTSNLALIAARHLEELATLAAVHLKKIADEKIRTDAAVEELQKTIDKKDAAIDELTRRIAHHNNA